MRPRLLFALLPVIAIGCGARTGLRVPDLNPPPGQPMPPPARCCDQFRTVHVRLVPDPLVPAPDRIDHVNWVFLQRCAGAQRVQLHCYISQAVRGNTDASGDCTLPALAGVPEGFHVGATTNRPDDIGFDFTGALNGQVCVSGTVFLAGGRSIPFAARMWPVQYCDPSNTWIPEITWWFRRPDGATESSVVPGSRSAEGCPTN